MLDWTDEQYETYIRIRNALDDIMHLLPGCEYKLMVYLMSRSLGRGEDSIALTFLDICGGGSEVLGGTGLSRASVIRGITSLLERGLITRTRGRMRDGFLYRVQVPAILNLIET